MKTEVFKTLLLVLAAAGSAISAFLASYAKKKGEQLATKHDFDELLRQVRRTTEVTEQIKAQTSSQMRVGESELEYRKAQLAEFYGPIYAHLKLSQELYGIWMAHKLRAVNKEIISLFREQNEAIIQIITTRAHLIDGDTIPDVFTRFMTSVTIWNFFTARVDKPSVDDDVAALPQAKWPHEFVDYIYSNTQQLKKRLDHLYQEHSIERSVKGA
ncbi:MAG TPA: hypothetical protein VKG65_04955 [Terriglobales bacterium]|nr:hypothetical protein [Terriglobales bacterium]